MLGDPIVRDVRAPAHGQKRAGVPADLPWCKS